MRMMKIAVSVVAYLPGSEVRIRHLPVPTTSNVIFVLITLVAVSMRQRIKQIRVATRICEHTYSTHLKLYENKWNVHKSNKMCPLELS